MPIYEYRCPKCNKIFEEWTQHITEDHPQEPCPDCGTSSPRIMSETSFVLEGGGWYVTDYGYRKGIKEEGGSSSSSSSSSSHASSAGTGEKKAEASSTTSGTDSGKSAATSSSASSGTSSGTSSGASAGASSSAASSAAAK